MCDWLLACVIDCLFVCLVAPWRACLFVCLYDWWFADVLVGLLV